ncbi:flagellar filament capping protein FliD [Lysinibacillus sp. NPDC048646]|uniref:flagellar filament capping protein FliD n=1 Tax=Lysinibacillus sp. NPDC048646 TaxID=3390574 RepID=UPI003D041B0A
MVNRIGGLASGMDIDALVAKLMQAEKSPLFKLQQKKTTYEWQRDAYRGINTKLKTFDTYIADNLILKSMKSKTATVSNSTYASATATPSASGSLALEGVSQLASAARGLGDQINATSNTKLSELGIGSGVIKLNAIKPDGTMPTEGTEIVIDESMTISKFVEKINDSNAGVSALFENGRLSITAKNTGDNKNGAEVQVTAGADIFSKLGFTSLTGQTSGDLAQGGKNAIFQVNGIATERASNTFTISGYNITLKETFNAGGTINSMLTLSFNERKNAAVDLPAKESAFDTKKQAHADATDVYNLAKARLSSSLNDAQKVLYSELALETRPLLAELNYNQITKLAEIDFTDEEAARVAIANLTDADGFTPALKEALSKIEIGDLEEISDLSEGDFNAISKVEKLEKTFATLNKAMLQGLSGLGQGIEDALKTVDLSAENPFENLPDGPVKEKLKSLDKGTLEALQSLSGPEIEVLSVAADAQIKLTSAKTEMDQADSAYKAAITRNANAEANYKQLYKENIFKGDEADFEAAYQNHIANDTTPPQITPDPSTVSPVTITSTTNVDEMMNKIKEFVTTYNGLIKDLSEQTKETKYRSFAPLTDEQRKDMSESEIKLWEEKAKSGLLRSDTILRSGLAGMRALIYEANPAVSNQKFNTLFNVGITTTKNYSDGGQLEINENKLRKALEEDPDAVAALFVNLDGAKDSTVTVTDKDGNISTKEADTRGYLQKLRSSMDSFKIDIEKKAGHISSTEQSYSIGKNIVDANKRIDTWQEKLKNIEARYWKQFSAMEQAINKANSQSSMFMQGLGA